MGFLGDRLKATRAGEDFVKRLRFPTGTPQQATEAGRALKMVVYRAYLAGLEGASLTDRLGEFLLRFGDGLTAAQRADLGPEALRTAMHNIETAYRYGFERGATERASRSD